MKITAWVGVKDEIELVGPALAHLASIGVTHIIVSDAGSSDGTVEYLDRAARAGAVELLPYDEDGPYPETEDQLNRDALAMAEAAGSDWLILCDTDEFWLPESGLLQDNPGFHGPDILNVPRLNVALFDDGGCLRLPPSLTDYSRIYLHLGAGSTAVERRENLESGAEESWISTRPEPKVAIRLRRGLTLAEGGHRAIVPEGVKRRGRQAEGLVIAHLPFSTPGRFRKKAVNMVALVEKSGHEWPESSAWHWRRWARILKEDGGFEAEFARNQTSRAALPALVAAGRVESVADFLQRPAPERKGGK